MGRMERTPSAAVDKHIVPCIGFNQQAPYRRSKVCPETDGDPASGGHGIDVLPSGSSGRYMLSAQVKNTVGAGVTRRRCSASHCSTSPLLCLLTCARLSLLLSFSLSLSLYIVLALSKCLFCLRARFFRSCPDELTLFSVTSLPDSSLSPPLLRSILSFTVFRSPSPFSSLTRTLNHVSLSLFISSSHSLSFASTLSCTCSLSALTYLGQVENHCQSPTSFGDAACSFAVR